MRKTGVLFGLVLSSVLAWRGAAVRADAGAVDSEIPKPPPRPPEPGGGGDYRYQLILADAEGWASLALSGRAGSSKLEDLAMVAMFISAPIIHVANDNPSGARESFGLRVGLTLTGAMVGVLAKGDCPVGANASSSTCGMSAAFVGGMAGLATAQVLDWIFIAGEPHGPRKPRRGDFAVAPMFTAEPNGALAGAAGTF